MSWVYKDDYLLKEIMLDEVELNYCLLFDQYDHFKQNKLSQSPSWRDIILGNQKWGQSVQAFDVFFIAAPIMYFGPRYEQVASLNKLEQLDYSRKYTINDKAVIRVDLFDITCNPDEHREKQKYYWKTMRLSKLIEYYRAKKDSGFDAKAYERRAKIAKGFKKTP